jgi:CIC family chloride channel protein
MVCGVVWLISYKNRSMEEPSAGLSSPIYKGLRFPEPWSMVTRIAALDKSPAFSPPRPIPIWLYSVADYFGKATVCSINLRKWRKWRNFFAPFFYVGGVVGFCFCFLFQNAWSHIPLPLAHFTLVVMCGVMAGVQHKPYQVLFLIVSLQEMRNSFVPLMFKLGDIPYHGHPFSKKTVCTWCNSKKSKANLWIKDQGVLGFNHYYTCDRTGLDPIHPDAKARWFGTI